MDELLMWERWYLWMTAPEVVRPTSLRRLVEAADREEAGMILKQLARR